MPQPPAFVGQVVYLDTLAGESVAFILVERAWGTAVRDPVLVSSGAPGCGTYLPEVGQRMAVFGRADSSEPIFVGGCSNSRRLDRYEAEVAALGTPDYSETLSAEVVSRHAFAIAARLARRPTCDHRTPARVARTVSFDEAEVFRFERQDELESLLVSGWLAWQPKMRDGKEPLLDLNVLNLEECWLRACVSVEGLDATREAGRKCREIAPRSIGHLQDSVPRADGLESELLLTLTFGTSDLSTRFD